MQRNDSCGALKRSPFQNALCPDLPPRDSEGLKHGADYHPFLSGRRTRIGTASSVYSLKTGRVHEYLSRLESRLHFILELNPDVIDFREQYPLYDEESIRNALESGTPIARNKVMTLDVLVTLRNKLSGELHYRGISLKYSQELRKPEVWLRFRREKGRCGARDWPWTVFTEQDVPITKSWSARRIVGFALRTTSDEYFPQSQELADFLARYNHRYATLDVAMAKAAKSLRYSNNHAYKLFGTACILGYLRPDLSKDIRTSNPLYLL